MVSDALLECGFKIKDAWHAHVMENQYIYMFQCVCVDIPALSSYGGPPRNTDTFDA